MRESSGVHIFKRFAEGYVEVMGGLLEQMKRNVLVMGRLGHDLGKRYVEVDPSVAEMAAESSIKTQQWSNEGRREIKPEEMPQHLRKFLQAIKSDAESAIKKG